MEESAVIRLIAAGLSPEAVAKRLSERLGQDVAIRDIRSVLRRTVTVMESGASLLPPAEAAFVKHLPAIFAFAGLAQGETRAASANARPAGPDNLTWKASATDLDRLRAIAHEVLQAHLGEKSAPCDYLSPGQAREQHVALQYAEAILRQAEVIAALNDLGDEAPLQAALPGPDRERINEFLLYRNLRGHFETLDSLVAAWRQLVDALDDHPRSLLYEEYADRLSKRDSLEDALSLVSLPTRKRLDATAARFDELFFESTRPVSTSIKSGSAWVPQRWWWYRIPRQLHKDFEHRVRRLESAT